MLLKGGSKVKILTQGVSSISKILKLSDPWHVRNCQNADWPQIKINYFSQFHWVFIGSLLAHLREIGSLGSIFVQQGFYSIMKYCFDLRSISLLKNFWIESVNPERKSFTCNTNLLCSVDVSPLSAQHVFRPLILTKLTILNVKLKIEK